MTENSIELDAHRGMAAQKATEARRHTVEVEADQAVLRQRQDEMEHALCAGPASTWVEAGEKARYLISLFAATPEGRDPRHQTLIADTLDDIRRLSATPPPDTAET
jgi:translation initiation factor IF-3